MKKIHFLHRHVNFTSKVADKSKLKSSVKHSLRMIPFELASEKCEWEPELETENFIYINDVTHRLYDFSFEEKSQIFDDITHPPVRDVEKNKKVKRQYKLKIKRAINTETKKGNKEAAYFLKSIIDYERFYSNDVIDSFSKLQMQRKTQRINMLKIYLDVQNKLLDVPNRNNTYVQEGIFKIPHQWEVSNKTITAQDYIDVTKKFLAKYFSDYPIKAIVVHDDERRLNQDTGIHVHYFLSAKNNRSGCYDLCQHQKDITNKYISLNGNTVNVNNPTRKDTEMQGHFFQRLVFEFFNHNLLEQKGLIAELSSEAERKSERRIKMNKEASLPKAQREYNFKSYALELMNKELNSKKGQVLYLDDIAVKKNDEICQLDNDITDKQILKKQTDATVKTKTELSAQLEDKLSSKKQEITELDNRIEQQNISIRKKEATKVNLDKNIDVHKQNLEKIQLIESKKTDSINELESKCTQLDDDIDARRATIESLESVESSLTQKIQTLEKQLKVLTEKTFGQIMRFSRDLFGAYIAKDTGHTGRIQKFVDTALFHLFDAPTDVRDRAKKLCDELELGADTSLNHTKK